MGTGGGGAEIANMEIFTKKFQHFWSKNLSDGAFFNVIGSKMDANVITSNEHQQIMFQPSKLNIMMMSIWTSTLNIMMKSMIEESEAKLGTDITRFKFCHVILSSSQILTMDSPATMMKMTMIMMMISPPKIFKPCQNVVIFLTDLCVVHTERVSLSHWTSN